MASQWMPQNLQKRLFVYILQQLSLFSGIDTTNLDVSLGSSTQVTLKDVDLDTEAIQIPGVYMRSGRVQSLELRLNVSGGVNLDGDGLNLTIALAPQNNNGSFSEDSKFSLAKSAMDLATSMIYNDEVIGDEDEEEKQHEEQQLAQEEEEQEKQTANAQESAPSNSSDQRKQPSALNSVMKKAAETALARLQVNLSNIVIRVIMNEATIDLKVEKITLKTIDGVREVKVSDVLVLAVSPTTDPGVFQEDSNESIGDETLTGKPDLSDTIFYDPSQVADRVAAPSFSQEGQLIDDGSDEDEDENETEDSDSDDDDDDSNLMSASSILRRPTELSQSLVYSKDQASTIYMSTRSHFGNSEASIQEKEEKSSVIASINSIDISFTGLAEVNDLEILIDEINIAAKPLPKTLLHILESLSQLNSKESFLKNPNSNLQNLRSNGVNLSTNANSKNTTQQNLDSADNIFDTFKINRIELNFISAISPNGKFSKPNCLRLITEDLNIIQKDSELIYGGLRKFKLLNNENDSVISFDNDENTTKNDFRFELRLKSNEFTFLFPNNLDVSLDKEIIQEFLNFTSLFSQILDSLNKLKNSNSVPSSTSKDLKPPTIIFQTSLIQIKLQITENSQLRLNCYPISYESEMEKISVNKISIDLVKKDNKIEQLLKLKKLEINISRAEKQLKAFDGNGYEIILSSLNFIDIESIEVTQDFKSYLSLIDDLQSFKSSLVVPNEKVYFKIRKKARISTGFIFKQKQSVNLITSVKDISFKIANIMPKFGDLLTSLKDMTLIFYKENYIQLYSMELSVKRILNDEIKENFIDVINKDDKGSPIVSVKIRESKTISLSLRNVIIDYYTQWLSLLENKTSKQQQESDYSESEISDFYFSVKVSLQECAIGLNPGRLSSKSNLVIKNGNVDLTFAQNQINIRGNFGPNFLLLIDDIKNINKKRDSIVDIKKISSLKKLSLTSQVNYFNNCGYLSVAKIQRISIDGIIRNQRFVKVADRKLLSNVTSLIEIDLGIENLDLELCGDSFQCLMQLINDLKQPIYIKNEIKYKSRRDENINVFEGVDENEFKVSSNSPESSDFISSTIIEDLNIVEDYYEEHLENESNSGTEVGDDNDIGGNNDIERASASDSGATSEEEFNRNDFLSNFIETNNNDSDDDQEIEEDVKDRLNKLSINNLNRSSQNGSDSGSDSVLLFNDEHFQKQIQQETNPVEKKAPNGKIYPLGLVVFINKATIHIFDGYDFKHTRTAITNCVKRLEKKILEEQEKKKVETLSEDSSLLVPNEDIFAETLFDSIHVSVPANAPPSKLIQSINREIQSEEVSENQDERPIEFGKTNVKKLRLKRTKTPKILIELSNINVEFKLLTDFDPLNSNEINTNINDQESEIVNEILVTCMDFNIIDKVPSSTWNKFVTLMKDEERQVDSPMFSLKMQTVRPISTLPTTELILDVNVLPLRLHVDQDTLDLLIRFGEFKDSRFVLIDEIEDIIYIEKFKINSVKIKLDYKPKSLDYAGLRSGRTDELMNLFILDGATMILKQVTLYGVSGFPKLGKLLNGLWMPDIKSTQLSGVLSGLAPVRSIVQLGGDFKDLVAIPIQEYQKDGRIYRSISKGASQFTKSTTNELLKLAVKLAAGTQTILENTEEVFGGTGSASRVSNSAEQLNDNQKNNKNHRANDYIIREEEDVETDEDEDNQFSNSGSQLIGRSSLSTVPIQRSIYQPALESFSKTHKSSKGYYKRTLKNNYEFIQEDDEVDEEDLDIEDTNQELPRTISLYANQPTNLKEGVALAYDSLGRNFFVAKEAIIKAYNSEFNDNGNINQQGYNEEDEDDFMNRRDSRNKNRFAVVKAAPIALLRPMIGATEAVSKTLLGLTNQLDPEQLKYTKDKYKEAPNVLKK